MKPLVARMFVVVAVIGAVGVLAFGAQASQGFTIVDLGTLGGSYSAGVAVNPSGQVVGSSYTAAGSQHAFSWTQAGGMVDLGTLGGTRSDALAVNDGGQVVGYSQLADGSSHAFSWTQASGMVDLGTMGGDFSWALAVNDNGQVVGTSYMGSEQHAFSWTQAGGMIDLGTLGGSRSDALAVNGSGHVVGSSFVANGDTRAFSWTQAGGMVNLGTLGGFWSAAIGVNASGQVVGTTLTAAPENRAFSWTPAEGMVELRTLGGRTGTASDVNDAGQVIGSSTNADEQFRATLWNPAGDDTTPPEINVLDGVTADATGRAGALVTYRVTAADETDPNPTVLCTPPSGTNFPIGTTTVNCTAKDTSGNQSTASFTVRVKGAQEQLQDLLHSVDSQKLGTGTSLHDKLVRALKLLGQEDVAGTCDTLNSFLASVRAQTGKSLTPAQAAPLTADALRIENVIGC